LTVRAAARRLNALRTPSNIRSNGARRRINHLFVSHCACHRAATGIQP